MSWPTDADLLAAWQRLAADSTTFGEFAALALAPLAEMLADRCPLADEADVFDAATEALYALRKHPDSYDPTLSPLRAYLSLIARRKLINRLESGRRHREGRIPWDSVELHAADRNDEVDAERLTWDDPRILAAIDRLPDADRSVFEQMKVNSRDTAAFVALLGLAHLSVDEQRREVKKAKDRVTARLRRARGGGDG